MCHAYANYRSASHAMLFAPHEQSALRPQLGDLATL